MDTLIYRQRPKVPVKRRVFFSFHYADVYRVNQVRNSWRFRRETEREAYGFFDGSLWERSKRQGDSSLKKLIYDGIDGTSVTCVLVSNYTYTRRWVRYEIARSVARGNGLLSVRINQLGDPYRNTTLAGPDPLEYMGVYRSERGNIFIAEKNQYGKWILYKDYTLSVKIPACLEQPQSSAVIPLKRYAKSYCYVSADGYRNFGSWVASAAMTVGR
jgi:hypothetical protein